jgi:hypothetical protein
MARPSIIEAAHPVRGTVWAMVDPSAHHVAGKVADLKFSARLAPFRSEADALAALAAAGATIPGAPK